jgi:TonB family protein
MTWNPRQRTAALLPFVLVALLVPSAAPAQETPAQPLQPQPPRYLLGGVEPLLNDQMKVVDLLAARKWREARTLAHQQFLVLAGYTDQYPASVATGLVLEALADAGLGDEGGALCRWQAAQHLDPNFAKGSLSSFGAPGTLLDSHSIEAPPPGPSPGPEPLRLPAADPEKKAKEALEVERPKILAQLPPQYPLAARKQKVEGTVIVESIIDRDGSILNARILKNQPMGLGISAVEAVCGWRFKPATLKGEPVKVYYVLTVTFKLEKSPPPLISHP